eukprot:804376-Prymnesium_polylepis.1
MLPPVGSEPVSTRPPAVSRVPSTPYGTRTKLPAVRTGDRSCEAARRRRRTYAAAATAPAPITPAAASCMVSITVVCPGVLVPRYNHGTMVEAWPPSIRLYGP